MPAATSALNSRPTQRASFALWVLLFVPLAMVQFHAAGHTITAADIWLLGFSLLQFALGLLQPVRHLGQKLLPTYIFAFLAYLSVVALGFGYAGDRAGVAKELLKWTEIFVMSLGVAFYCKDLRRFANLYWAMFFIILGQCLLPFAYNIAHAEPLHRIYATPDWAIALALPFLAVRWVRTTFLWTLAPLLILSYSRLSWATAAICFVLLLYVSGSTRIERRKIAVAVVSAVALIGITSIFVHGIADIVVKRILVTFSSNPRVDQSAFTRAAMIIAGVLDFIHHPLSGVWAGNFKYYVLTHQAQKINFVLTASALPNSPHSVVIQTAAETGIPGLIAGAFVVYALIRGVKAGYRQNKHHPSISPYATGMALFLVPLFVTLLASNIGDTNRTLIGLYFGLALAISSMKATSRPPTATPRLPQANFAPLTRHSGDGADAAAQ